MSQFSVTLSAELAEPLVHTVHFFPVPKDVKTWTIVGGALTINMDDGVNHMGTLHIEPGKSAHVEDKFGVCIPNFTPTHFSIDFDPSR
jgi:hypothetical protein